jgi:hypothetical protein
MPDDHETRGWDETLLLETGRSFAYPATPDLLAGVERRLRAPARQQRRPAFGLVAAALWLVAVAAVVTVSWGEARMAVAGLFGFAIEGERVELLPTPAPGTTATPLPEPAELDTIATAAPFLEAELAFGQRVLLPGGQPPPAAYIVELHQQPTIILHYADFDLWQVRGGSFGKGVDERTIVERLTVAGEEALWITGGRRLLTSFDAEGNEVTGAQRTVDRNALIWAQDGVFYRIETDRDLDAALAIAGSLR